MRLAPASVLSLAFCALIATAQPAAATVIFSDNFNGENGGSEALNYTGFANWTVFLPGSVDLIGNGGTFDFYPGNGLYVDLDGSTDAGGTLTTIPSFGPGSYVLSFNLAGSARFEVPIDSNTVVVRFGGVDISGGGFALGSSAPFNPPQSLSFTAAAPGQISFENSGGDNIGLILDNVVLDQVPEPGSLLLLGSGLAGLGVWRRRRSA
jgi:hypothetical protein